MWRVVGASVVGTSHTKTGKPCQDANDYRVLSSGIVLAAVADGLGSAERSELGSQLAVDTALEVLEGELSRPLPADSSRLEGELTQRMKTAFTLARRELEEVANREVIPLRELGTTLMVVACGPDSGPPWTVAGHIGDGAVVSLWRETEELTTLSPPERGEYANMTKPLTMDKALDQIRYTFRPDRPAAVVLMSDGLQNLALDARDNAPFEGFFRPLIRDFNQNQDTEEAGRQLVGFLKSDRLNLRTDDDKTLIIIEQMGFSPAPADWQPPVSQPQSQPDALPPIPAGASNAQVILYEGEWLEAEAQELEQISRDLEEMARRTFGHGEKKDQKLAARLMKSAREYSQRAKQAGEQAAQKRASINRRDE